MENLFEIDSFIADDTPETLFDEVEVQEEDTEKSDEETTETVEVEEIDEPETDEVETEEIEEVEDPASAKTFYNVVKDFLPVEDTDDPNEDFLREQFEALPEKFFMEYVGTRPDWFKDMLVYQNNLDNPTPEKMSEFFNKYIIKEATHKPVETEEDARRFLKSSDVFKRLYDTDEDMDEALDLLADKGKILDKAKQFEAGILKQREKEKEEELKRLETEKANKLQKEKEFAGEIRKVINDLDWQEAQKQKALREINSKNISDKWSKIHTNPKYLVEFGNLLSYFSEDKGFQDLYEKLEGKSKSQQSKRTKENLEKDSLGKLFKPAVRTSGKGKDDLSDFIS